MTTSKKYQSLNKELKKIKKLRHEYYQTDVNLFLADKINWVLMIMAILLFFNHFFELFEIKDARQGEYFDMYVSSMFFGVFFCLVNTYYRVASVIIKNQIQNYHFNYLNHWFDKCGFITSLSFFIVFFCILFDPNLVRFFLQPIILFSIFVIGLVFNRLNHVYNKKLKELDVSNVEDEYQKINKEIESFNLNILNDKIEASKFYLNNDDCQLKELIYEKYFKNSDIEKAHNNLSKIKKKANIYNE